MTKLLMANDQWPYLISISILNLNSSLTPKISILVIFGFNSYSRQVFNDFDESQETIILKHKNVGGEDIPDHKQQEPLSMISFITMTTIIEFLNTGFLKVRIHSNNA